MSKEEKAAAHVQARWRGYSNRKEHCRKKHSAVRIQALQRGRSTRRQYREYLSIQREQVALQKQREKRHERILRHKRDLYILQTTPADKLSRLLDIRERHSARKIQRCWRKSTGRIYLSPRDRRRRQNGGQEDRDDFPIELDAALNSADEYDSADYSTEEEEEKDGTAAAAASPLVHSALESAKALALEQRVSRLCQKQIDEWNKDVPEGNGRKAKLMHRYTKYIDMKHEILRQYDAYFKHNDGQDALRRKRKVLRCNRWIEKLSGPMPLENIQFDTTTDGGQDRAGQKSPEAWLDVFPLPKSQVRLKRAQIRHANKMKVVDDCNAWWHVFVDGKKQDIRKITAPWPWPHDDANNRSPQFVEKEADQRVDARTASIWWTAFAGTYRDEHKTRIIPTEAITSVHDDLIFQKRLNEEQYDQALERINNKAGELSQQVLHQMDAPPPRRLSMVHSMSNTPFDRKMRQEEAAICIQSLYRGHAARSRAYQLKADQIAQGGTASAQGRCEECGESRAVLKCDECVDSKTFCPNCWVHVHSTRRRRRHTAVPIFT